MSVAALRQQAAILKRSVKRPQLDDDDRLLWIMLRRHFAEWRDSLHVMKPSTVIGWHRRGYRYSWARKSKLRRVGHPSIPWTLVHLIRRMAIASVSWGAPRFHDERARTSRCASPSGAEQHDVARDRASVDAVPFAGGLLVPTPDAVVPVPARAGDLVLQGTLPANLPSGLAFWTQFWIADEEGFASSSAVRTVTP